MRILLTAAAAARAGDQIREVAPSIELLEMQDDGALLLDGRTPVEWDDAGAEVAWTSFDLFAGGPVRPFFGFLMRSTSLRWLQLSNAGVDHPVFADLFRRGLKLTTSHVTDIPIAEFVIMISNAATRPRPSALGRRIWEITATIATATHHCRNHTAIATPTTSAITRLPNCWNGHRPR